MTSKISEKDGLDVEDDLKLPQIKGTFAATCEFDKKQYQSAEQSMSSRGATDEEERRTLLLSNRSSRFKDNMKAPSFDKFGSNKKINNFNVKLAQNMT